MDHKSLELLACPQNHMRLRFADASVLLPLNAAIEQRRVKTVGGRTVEAELQGALVRVDNVLLYPIVDDIPILLPEEAMALDQLEKARP